MTTLQSVIGPIVTTALVTMNLALAVHAATLTEHMDIECCQPKSLSLQCDYRILSGVDLVSSVVEH